MVVRTVKIWIDWNVWRKLIAGWRADNAPALLDSELPAVFSGADLTRHSAQER
jgi:hypothetical protein